MKFHLATESGRWIGGFMCRKSELAEVLDEHRDTATLWNSPLVATRLDRGRRETYRIEPRADVTT